MDEDTWPRPILAQSLNRRKYRHIPRVAISRYPPPGAARKKSTPTPAATILSAVFLQPGCSVVKSFFSASPPCCLPSSRKNNRPGPQVGRADNEHTIFPPVFSRAANAAFRVGRSAGSGFLICANSDGSWVSNAVMFALSVLESEKIQAEGLLTLLRRDQQTSLHREAQRDLLYPALSIAGIDRAQAIIHISQSIARDGLLYSRSYRKSGCPCQMSRIQLWNLGVFCA